MSKDFFQLRHELEERRKQGLPTWAKTAAVGMLAKVNADASAYANAQDQKTKDKRLASAITTSAAISTLGLAVSTKDKSLMGRAKSLAKRK